MAKVFIYETPFKHTLSPSKLMEALDRVEEARAFGKKLREQLLIAIAKGDSSKQQKVRDQIISDPRSRLFSAIRANSKLKPAKREPLETCLYVASSLDFSKPLEEEVLVHPQKKKSGGYRAICEFGLCYRTGQDLVLRIMECHLNPHPIQYKDVPGAILGVEIAIDMEFVYSARLDISGFYESFELEKLSSILPVSHELVEHVVFGRHMKVKGTKVKGHCASPSSWDILLAQSRRGLPQGSACSPIIGAFCVSHLVWLPTDGVIPINYVDDFLLLAKSQKLLEGAIGELVQAIAELPGGHFVPQIMEKSDVLKGIKFLGHKMQFLNGNLKTSVSRATVEATLSQWNELERKVSKYGLIVGQTDIDRAKELLARMFAFAQGWRAAFKQCDDVDEYVSAFIAQIEDYAKTLNVDLNEIIALVDESMKYRPNAYTLGK